MRQEQEQVLKVGARIMACLAKCAPFYIHSHWEMAGGSVMRHSCLLLCRLCQEKGTLAAAANALLLHKCLKQRMWDSSGVEVRQLPGIGRLLGDRLAGAGLGKLRQLEAADPRRIEAITQRHFPFGVLLYTMPV